MKFGCFRVYKTGVLFNMEQYFFLNPIMSQVYVDFEWTLCGKLHPLEVSNFIFVDNV